MKSWHRLLLVLLGLTGILRNCAAQEDIRLLPPIESVVPGNPEPVVPPTSLESGTGVLEDGTAVVDGVAYPAWAKPFYWFAGPMWDGSLEMGMNGSHGNADSLSFRVGSSLKRDTPKSTLELLINYGRNHQGSVETQNNGLMSGRWDWKLANPDWIYFNRYQIEYDRFKAFDLRLTLATGFGYHLIKDDISTVTPRMGLAVSHEFGGPDESWVPEADFGVDFTHQISKRQSIKGSVDYYPSWEHFTDFRLVSQAHWEVVLDEETNLSFKLGAIDRYDSTPNGKRPNDVDYYFTLIWKI